MKTLYLHIGTPKTATSSIQNFLAINRNVLEKHSYCFPKSLEKTAYVNPKRNAHFLITDYFLEDGSHDIQAEDACMLRGMEQIHDLLLQVDNVILSEENIWRFSSYSRKRLFPFIADTAREFGYQVKIIVYLRRQDQFLLSRWNQNVKNSARSEIHPIREHLKEVDEKQKLVVNYGKKLDKIAEVFGKENVIVRRFDPKSWVNGSIIEDFMQCVGLEMTEEYQMPDRMVNPGLKGNTVEIKRLINESRSLTTDEKNYVGESLRKMSEDSGRRYPVSMLSVEETKALIKKYEKQNAYVAEQYIGDGKPLFDDTVADMACWEENNPYMQEDIIHFISETVVRLHHENEDLQSQIHLLQGEIMQLRSEIGGQNKKLRKVSEWQEKLKQAMRHPLRTVFRRVFRRKSVV